MYVNLLYHVVRKVIEPKYPWIDDFVWTQFFHDGYEYYSLEITPKKDFRERRSMIQKYEVEIGNQMKSLFEMLAPESHQKFYSVSIL